MLIEEDVFGEGVVGDVGDPLEGPFLRLDDFRGDVGDLHDVAHGWRDSLSVDVSSD